MGPCVHKSGNGDEKCDGEDDSARLGESKPAPEPGSRKAVALNPDSKAPKDAKVLWAGTDDGLVHVSRDGGIRWENVTAAIPDLPRAKTRKPR